MSQNEHRRTQADIANDGTNEARPENAHGLAGQQQGASPLTTPNPGGSTGHHGGNHGNDAQDNNDQRPAADNSRGSSHRGDEPNAESKNTGGGPDTEHQNPTKNTTNDKSDYATGQEASSAANDGGRMGDADNPA